MLQAYVKVWNCKLVLLLHYVYMYDKNIEFLKRLQKVLSSL